MVLIVIHVLSWHLGTYGRSWSAFIICDAVNLSEVVLVIAGCFRHCSEHHCIVLLIIRIT